MQIGLRNLGLEKFKKIANSNLNSSFSKIQNQIFKIVTSSKEFERSQI